MLHRGSHETRTDGHQSHRERRRVGAAFHFLPRTGGPTTSRPPVHRPPNSFLGSSYSSFDWIFYVNGFAFNFTIDQHVSWHLLLSVHWGCLAEKRLSTCQVKYSSNSWTRVGWCVCVCVWVSVFGVIFCDPQKIVSTQEACATNCPEWIENLTRVFLSPQTLEIIRTDLETPETFWLALHWLGLSSATWRKFIRQLWRREKDSK